MPKPAAPDAPQPIAKPEGLNDKDLLDAIKAYNAFLANELVALFPEDLTPSDVRDHLVKNAAAHGKLGTARSAVKGAVETKTDLVKRATAIHNQVLGLVNASTPPGAVGRADYFPTANTDPDLGELLAALGKGIAKRKRPPLPPTLTTAGIIELGEAVSAALQSRETTGDNRSGQSRATAAFERRTLEIRRRLRELALRYFGYTSDKLIEFGLKPRVFVGGRKRKVSTDAPKPAPDGGGEA